jgi:hypothetical protein
MGRPAKPKAPKLRWDIYCAAAKAKLLGAVEAAAAEEAVAVGAKEFGQDPKRLIAVLAR